MRSRYLSGGAVALLAAQEALAHPGHLPIEHGVTHELQAPEHVMWWGAVGVAAAIACLVSGLRKRARAAKRSGNAAAITTGTRSV